NFTVAGGGSTSQAVTGLSGGTTYYYRVRAVSGSGTSPSSSTIIVLTLPPAPLANDPFLVGSTAFTASWNSSTGAASYRLDVSTVSNFAALVTSYSNKAVSGTSSDVNTNLSAGTQYYYRVRAIVAGVASTNSNTVTLITTPAAPTTTAATTVGSDRFDANWTSVTGAVTYRLDLSAHNC